VGDFVRKVLDILGDEVGHFPVLGMAPTVLDGIEFRRIRWEIFDMDTGTIERLEEPGGLAVATPAIPDQQQGALQMAMELLHKGKDVLSREIRARHGKIAAQALALGGDGERSGHGEAIVAVPARVDGRFAPWCPGATHRRLEHEAGLIDQDQGAPVTPGFF
jgi:hypothetical protein